VGAVGKSGQIQLRPILQLDLPDLISAAAYVIQRQFLTCERLISAEKLIFVKFSSGFEDF